MNGGKKVFSSGKSNKMMAAANGKGMHATMEKACSSGSGNELGKRVVEGNNKWRNVHVLG